MHRLYSWQRVLTSLPGISQWYVLEATQASYDCPDRSRPHFHWSFIFFHSLHRCISWDRYSFQNRDFSSFNSSARPLWICLYRWHSLVLRKIWSWYSTEKHYQREWNQIICVVCNSCERTLIHSWLDCRQTRSKTSTVNSLSSKHTFERIFHCSSKSLPPSAPPGGRRGLNIHCLFCHCK